MDMYINDLSFQGQFKDFEEAIGAFEILAKAISSSNMMRGSTPVRRTKALKTMPVCQDKSIYEFLAWLLAKSSTSPKYKDVSTLVLQHIVQGPFVDMNVLDLTIKDLIAPCNRKIEDSLIHAALSERYSSFPALVSIQMSEGYNCSEITFEGSNKKIINLFSENCATPFLRQYEPNPKHEIKESKAVAGKVHSKMDITIEVAQQILDQGIHLLSKNAIFSFYNDKWYQFPAHGDCKFHGYPIGKPTNNTNINLIISNIGLPPYPENGYKILS